MTTTHKVIGPFEAYAPEDGGKWELNCQHVDINNEPVCCAIVQDTNRARLNAWKKVSVEWCSMCQQEEWEK